ncbi:hypothetical protein D5S18_18625 [Nocardia panacis]|uniref:Head-to-tail stopper n=1 Tax=Nocardia panacis TaxID=2340916 RepID=A0A3A4K8Y7_9NOCA|nr:hypothetical protein [Nocardia panacis]RJO74169.1 hypothetical protein D5S18_18625 [Nocardia panacis]
MTFFANGQTVTVIPPGTRDRVGDTVPGIPFPVDNVSVAIHGSTQNFDRRTTVETPATLEFPSGTVIALNSHFVLANGSKWVMTGRAHTPRNGFTGWQPGVTVLAKEVL